MSRSLGRWQTTLLGVVVLAAIGLGTLGLFAVGNRSWFGADPLELSVGFDNIRGVEIGTRVRLQGIDAGEVTAVEPPALPGKLVTLRLRLRGEFRPLVLAGSTVQIVSEGLIGAKVLEVSASGIEPGSADARPAADGATLHARGTVELADVLGEVKATLQSMRAADGTLAKLINDPKAYQALVSLLEQGKETMSAFHEDAEAFKRLPVVRGYVEDPTDLLVRPRCERNRQVIAEEELFDPGRAVLTATGMRRLDDLGPWLDGLKQKGSEVVVVAYADAAKSNPQVARAVTKQQSEAVVEYLRQRHSVQKLGWFRSRKVTALGLGVSAPPVAETDALPPARVEVVVFVQQ